MVVLTGPRVIVDLPGLLDLFPQLRSAKNVGGRHNPLNRYKAISLAASDSFMQHTDLSCAARAAEGFYTSEVQSPEQRTIRTFLPVGYEPNYAYPLLVFFHGHGGDEEQVLRLAPRLSRRNYICIGLQGPEAVGPRRTDGPATLGARTAPTTPASKSTSCVRSSRRGAAITSTPSASTWRDSVKGPRWPIGWASRFRSGLPACCPSTAVCRGEAVPCCGWLTCELRVFIGHGIANAVVPLALARRDHLLLYTAGLPVRMHTYATTHRIHPDMLRDVNRWIMSHINDE